MLELDFKNKNIVLSDEVKLTVSLLFSALFAASLISGNVAFYAMTSFFVMVFFVVTVFLKPYLFLAVFFAVSYPVSQTIGKLGIDNLGILFLLSLSLLSVVFIAQRKNFAVDKRKIAVFSYFYVIVALVVAGIVSGFLHSGPESLEVLVKFFAFGVIPVLFLILMPLNKENLTPLLELSYYLNFIIFMGFSIAYWFFKILNPAAFDDFFYGFDNPIGTSLFMMGFSAVSLIFVTFKDVSKKTKIFIYATVALALLYVVMTFQRSFVVAIFATLCYFVVFKYKIGIKMILAVLAVAVVLSLFLSNISLFLSSDRMAKFEKTMEFVEKLSKNKNILRTQENKDTGTIGIRIIKILASWDKTKEHIYLGNGIGTFSATIGDEGYKYPHNIFYEFLYSTGLAGLLIFVFIAGKIFLGCHFGIKKIKDPKLKAALLSAQLFVVLSIVVLQFTGGVMNIFPNTFFIMCIIVLTLNLYGVYKPENKK